MAITIVQTLSKTVGSAVTSVQSSAFGSSPTSGNTIIVGIAVFNDGSPSDLDVSDTAGNTYTRDAHNENGTPSTYTNSSSIQIWRCTNITGGANFKITVTKHTGGGVFYPSFAAIEVSGLQASPIDALSAGDSATNTTPDTGTWTTTNANDLLVIGVASDGSPAITTPTGFTSFMNNGPPLPGVYGDIAYKIVSTTQSGINPQWSCTTSAKWYGVGAAEKGPTAAANQFPFWLLMGSSPQGF